MNRQNVLESPIISNTPIVIERSIRFSSVSRDSVHSSRIGHTLDNSISSATARLSSENRDESYLPERIYRYHDLWSFGVYIPGRRSCLIETTGFTEIDVSGPTERVIVFDPSEHGCKMIV